MTAASACFDVSATLVALTVSLVAPAGAEYRPFVSMEPEPECCSTLQVTAVFVVPVTVALNWKVELTDIVFELGVMVIVIGAG